MYPFDLDASLERARLRLGDTAEPARRAPRSDRGRLRLAPGAVACVADALAGYERPPMRMMLAGIQECCRAQGVPPPSRATVYKMMATLVGGTFRKRDLPLPVQAALYNLAPESEVPGHQVAFYCFNYGDLRAVSFAAGLPWLSLYQALRMPGHRPKSRGLLEAVSLVRRI